MLFGDFSVLTPFFLLIWLLLECLALQPDGVGWGGLLLDCHHCYPLLPSFFFILFLWPDCVSHSMPATDNPISFHNQLKMLSPPSKSSIFFFLFSYSFFFFFLPSAFFLLLLHLFLFFGDTVAFNVREAFIMSFCVITVVLLTVHHLPSFSPTHSDLLQVPFLNS